MKKPQAVQMALDICGSAERVAHLYMVAQSALSVSGRAQAKAAQVLPDACVKKVRHHANLAAKACMPECAGTLDAVGRYHYIGRHTAGLCALAMCARSSVG